MKTSAVDVRLLFAVLYFYTFLTNVYSINPRDIDIDTNGYIAYCPCMGRFGNQADHFLGVLGFAIGLNRTLILPPWVEYRTGETRSIQVPFDRYFNATQMRKCHKTMLMHDFMNTIAPIMWPPRERVAFCYSPRGELADSCHAKEGNPFGPFWDTFNIDFVKSEFYGPLHYDVYHSDMVQQWKSKYPSSTWSVLAFTGAPASFPIQLDNKRLQRCLVWNDEILQKANSFVKKVLPRGRFIGIHLRNGADWLRACEYAPKSLQLFSSPQCLGYRNEHGKTNAVMCLPPFDTISVYLKRIIRNNDDVKSVFVSSDNNHMIEELSVALSRMNVKVFRQSNPISPHLDLAILARSNFFIGNCISSFSAFVAREREIRGYPTYFWGFPPERSTLSTSREEL